jgi:outer membrane protein assembly factor BamB
MKRPLLFAFVLSSFTALLTIPAFGGADWSQWRGPSRDGKSADTDLLKTWPEGGPKLTWKATGLGKGYAGVAVSGHLLYTMGDLADGNHVLALGASDGKIAWATKVGRAGMAGPPGWTFAGPRCTPTVNGDLLFAADHYGELVCLRTADGQELWRKNYQKDFEGQQPEWGFAESPLVDGEQVVITPGGSNGAIIALKKSTGALLWRSKGFTDAAQYASIIPAQIHGVPQYIQLTIANVVGVSPRDGAVLWKAARKGAVAVIPTPIVDGDLVYVTSGYAIGCNLFKVKGNSGTLSAEQVYANKVMANHHGGVVKVGGHLYGYSDGKGLTCQSFASGEAVWAEKEKIKKCAVSYADGLLYCREEDSGTVVLVEASPTAYAEKGRLVQPQRAEEKAWPHPTISGGKLYLRDQDLLFCYDVNAKAN